MPDPIPLRGTSLHDGVAARLRAMVFDGDLPPDAFIDEKAEHRNFKRPQPVPAEAPGRVCRGLEYADRKSVV